MRKRPFAHRLLGIIATSAACCAAAGCFIIIDPTEYDTGIGREGGGATFGFDDLDAATDARRATDASIDAEAAPDNDAAADDAARDAQDEFG